MTMRSHSDTFSEISDASTTGTERSSCYSDYRDELQEFAVSLGYKSADELFFDRFKVDRKRLEVMLLGKSDYAKSAEEFFQMVMKETQTMIKWPEKLKIGAKSKKDPHIKVFGLEKNVSTAKQIIMSVLDTRSNRVTMKLDVSYTDHSHIIGKGGLRIKKVMEDTSCHIHFPDSNRNNQEEKSNQVSIAGEIYNIEMARARVRELTPLIFCFELPNVGTVQNPPELNSPYVLSIQEEYNVQVMCRTRAKLHSTMVMVKGCEWEVKRVKEATIHLINYMCCSFANQATVQMMMEISPQYHSIVLGAQQQNLKAIIQHTKVQIMFPDLSDPYTPSLKKSSVIISGNIHKVYAARQMLLGSLPLVLMFDYTPDKSGLNNNLLEEIMQTLDVFVSVRLKPKQNIYSVIIKGLERNASNIYEARRQLMNAQSERPVKADIPSSYRTPGSVPTFLKSFHSSCSSNNNYNMGNIGNNNGINTPLVSMTMNASAVNNRANSVPYASIPPTVLNKMLPLMQRVSVAELSAAAAAAAVSSSSSPYSVGMNSPRTPVTHQTPHQTPPQQLRYKSWSVSEMLQSLGNAAISQHQHQHSTKYASFQTTSGLAMTNGGSGIASGVVGTGAVVGSSSNAFNNGLPSTTSSLTSDTKEFPLYSSSSCLSSDASSLSTSPRTGSPNNGVTDYNCSSTKIGDSNELSERKAPGFERSSVTNGTNSLIDYQQLRIQAAQAMQGTPNQAEYRTPTQSWAGYGFSHSSPSSLLGMQPTIKEDLTLTNLNIEDQEVTNVKSSLNDSMDSSSTSGSCAAAQRFAASNYLETAASSTYNAVTSSNYSDLPSLLASLGLQKYIQHFKAHEIDLYTFQTLTEADLKEIGVTALGARRKMMIFISELKKREQMNVFRGSAAPGAERKNSSCSSSPQNDNSSTSCW